MSNPHLLFCPYLPLSALVDGLDEPIEFAGWQLGPLRLFEDRWADPRFKSASTAFLEKFIGLSGKTQVQNFALLCKKGEKLDGRKPSTTEFRALELALAFGFLDSNPMEKDSEAGWVMVTTDNADLHLWSIDIEHGRLTLNRGGLVNTTISEFTSDNSRLVIAPPLDLHMPTLLPPPDPLVLTGIYETTLASLQSPIAKNEAHRIRVAVGWLAKAWRNTASIHYPERLVFLKTAFEALTGKSKAHQSASELRRIFESLQDATEDDAEFLVWSPTEKPIHNWNGNRITDLEAWFRAFSDVRNEIIHEGTIPDLIYPPNGTTYPITSREIYRGHFFSTAERLLRSAIKVLLSKMGYKEAWYPKPYRDLCDILESST